MNKLAKIFTTFTLAAALTATACGLAACGCDSAEETTTTETGITLPADEFDDTSEEDRLKQVKEDIDTIDTLQKDGVDTDEEKSAYNNAVKDVLAIAPELAETINAGKDDYKIDTEAANNIINAEQKQLEEEQNHANDGNNDSSLSTDENGEYKLPVETDENGNAEVIELPTVKVK